MLLNDGRIRKLISIGVLDTAGREKPIGPLSYDLTTRAFYDTDGEHDKYTLNPGESVFVGSDEIISLPDNLAGRVLLKNSRIREGLSMDAPLYFPGHKTRVYFRVTNVTANRISLDTAHDLASIAFEELSAPAEAPYRGAFVDEFDFRHMASYKEIYEAEIE